MNPSISRIILFVHDVEKVADFYQTAFGLRPLKPYEKGWIELEAGGCNLALHKAHGGYDSGEHSPAKIVFAVSNVKEEVNRLSTLGLEFGRVFEYEGFEFADTKDPAGNPIQISSRGVRKP